MTYQIGKYRRMSNLRQIRETRGFTLKEVADRIHTTEVSMSRYEREDNRLTLPLLRKLAKALSTTIAEIVGEGTPTDGSGNLVTIHELDVRAVAGIGVGSIDVWEESQETATVALHGFPAAGFRDRYGAAPEKVRILEVLGDSMRPTLNPGERIMVDTTDRRPSPAGLFVLWDGLGMVIKRVEFVPHSDPPAVRISSDNPRYSPYERALEEAYIQGRVIGLWART